VTIESRHPWSLAHHIIAPRVVASQGLYKYYPHTRGSVDFTMVGSSLTFNHFIGSHRGEVYGLESHPERFDMDDWLRPKSWVPGLYTTGQDNTTLGVTGALMSGVLTAHAVLGYGGVSDLLSGRNLVEDLWHLEAQQAKRKQQ
jgi:all-trans-retinol 13,14-reductase